MIAGVILGLLAGYTAIHFAVWRFAPKLSRWLGSVLAMTPAALLFVFGDVIGQISVAGYVGVSLLIDSINGDCGCEVMASTASSSRRYSAQALEPEFKNV